MLAFEEFLTGRTSSLLRFATVVAGSGHQAEDVVQDVLVKAHRRWDRIGALDHPEAYLRRMIVNEHVSWRRKWARIAPSPIELIDTPAPDPAERIVGQDALVEAVRALPPRQRAAVALRYYADQSDAEIAGILGCRVSTVRSQIARALAKLRIDIAATDIAATDIAATDIDATRTDPTRTDTHSKGAPDAHAR